MIYFLPSLLIAILNPMPKKRKEELKTQLPPLCAAVRRVREAYGETLEEFGRRVRVSLNSVSRFELGKTVPADFNVLGSLARAARERGLTVEADLFIEAQTQVRWRAYRGPTSEGTEPVYSPQEWRLMHAARIAVRLYPEHARAIEDAAGPAVGLVDEVLRSVDAGSTLDAAFYADLEQRLNELADRRALESLKQGRNK
jgi:transcriptional regulator with XRE-family HTH domain